MASEKETEDLLRELARINGWRDAKQGWREQRIQYDTTLRGTKYEGTVESKGQASVDQCVCLRACLR